MCMREQPLLVGTLDVASLHPTHLYNPNLNPPPLPPNPLGNPEYPPRYKCVHPVPVEEFEPPPLFTNERYYPVNVAVNRETNVTPTERIAVVNVRGGTGVLNVFRTAVVVELGIGGGGLGGNVQQV